MIRTLLVPLDGSEFSERSLPLARAIARQASGSLHLVQVHPPAIAGHLVSSSQFAYQGLDLEAYAERHREEARTHLEGIARELTAEGLNARATVLEGLIPETLAEHAEAIQADLVVMTTHGRTGANRLWLGSVADGLIRHTRVPVLLHHPAEEDGRSVALEGLRHILVPLDGSKLAEGILDSVKDLARVSGARLTLAHVVASNSAVGAGLVPLLPDDIVRVRDQADAYLTEVAERLRAKGLGVETYLTEDDNPAAAIASAAEEVRADVIALATHGYGGLRRAVLGSVADKVLRSSPLPLLIVRPAAEGS